MRTSSRPLLPSSACRLAPRTGAGVYFLVVAGVGLLASAGLFLLQCIPPRRFPRLQLGLCIAASAWWFAGTVAFAGEGQGSAIDATK